MNGLEKNMASVAVAAAGNNTVDDVVRHINLPKAAPASPAVTLEGEAAAPVKIRTKAPKEEVKKFTLKTPKVGLLAL